LGSEYLECASTYLTKEEFDKQVDYWLTNGYTCNLQ
jgi:ribulose bisphosphate carboxylase small subunit